jgi:hypothetical protein
VLSRIRQRPLWLLAAIAVAGLGIRLFFAVHWFGSGDILTFLFVGARAKLGFLHAYSTNIDGTYWPYPPGYLPWLVAAIDLSKDLNVAFDRVVQLLPIAADLGIAACVYVYLGWRGGSLGTRVAGFSLVMLGPVFIAISGYHGQLDAVAILPAVAGFLVWDRRRGSGRAVGTGALLGIGAVLKTVPMLMVVPLAASTDSMRERVRLVVAALAVVVAVCLPFYLAEPAGFRGGPLEYSGATSRGGLSLVADPGFAVDRRLSTGLELGGAPSELANSLSEASGPITAAVLLALVFFLFRYRPAAIDGVVLLWLVVFAFSPNFLLQYLVWALPFFIMAGYLWEAAILQVAVVPVLLLTYLSPSVFDRAGATAYVVMMICLWAFWVAASFILARRIVRGRPAYPSGNQPPLVRLAPGGSGA